MSFKYEQTQISVPLGKEEFCHYYVWSRDSGNLVVVVIDDECYASPEDPKVVLREVAVLPRLREQALTLPDTRAIGFFPLAKDETDADKVLKSIQEWLDKVTTSDARVYFLVDALHGYGEGATETAAPYTVNQLEGKPLYRDHIAYLTRAGVPGRWIDEEKNFIKANEALHIQKHGVLSPKLMLFLGKGRHADGLIDDAIQFYEKAWEAGWKVRGWQHDSFEDKSSEQLQALAEWLGDSVSIDDLYKSPDKGQSAKSLIIWTGGNPQELVWSGEDRRWEDPPWKTRDRRPIQGKVLNAVLNRLKIPLTVPDNEWITMPCVPCFPFCVSLRSFLWRCEQEDVKIKEIRFFKQGDNPQVNIVRLILDQDEVSHGLAESFFGAKRAGALTESLTDLTHCRTHKLTDELMGTGREYMCLLQEGTELPVVAVEIGPKQINLIWSVR